MDKIIKIGAIILIIILIATISIGIFDRIGLKKIIRDNKTVLEKTEQYKIEREQFKQERNIAVEEIKKLKNELEKKPKIITKEEIKYIGDKEKNQIIFNLQDENQTLREIVNKQDTIIQNDTKQMKKDAKKIEELEVQLRKSTKKLEKVEKPFGFDLYAMGGSSEKFDPKLIVGADFKANLLVNRLTITAGPWMQVYNERVYGGKLGIGFSFGKHK
jgi:cell division protein FtsB